MMLCCWGNALGKAEPPQQPAGNTCRNLIVVTLDGLRWQELFGGADTALLQNAGAQAIPKACAPSGIAYQHRQVLMPFFWEVIGRQGVLVGNRYKNSCMTVRNPYALSYAGYNELFSGAPDLRIWSNDPIDNSNPNIFEHLDNMPAYRGRVASFVSWPVFAHIFNRKRSRFFLDCAGSRQANAAVRSDTATFRAALQYLRRYRPRVLHLGLSGTDEAAHAADYPAYLAQAHLADSLVGRLWQEIQNLKGYRNQTTLVLTTDHGRGSGRHNWSRHGFFVRGSAQTWMALVGYGVKARGERTGGSYRPGQLAGTMAYLMDAGRFGGSCLPLTFFNRPEGAIPAYP